MMSSQGTSFHDTFFEIIGSGTKSWSPGSSFNNMTKNTSDSDLYIKYLTLAQDGERDLENLRCSLNT